MDNNNTELVAEWPDGTWCYMDEISQMHHKSDDYSVNWFDEKVHV